MLDTLNTQTLRWWVATQVALNDEEGVEAVEWLACAGAIILLLIAVGRGFNDGGDGLGTAVVGLIQDIAEFFISS